MYALAIAIVVVVSREVTGIAFRQGQARHNSAHVLLCSLFCAQQKMNKLRSTYIRTYAQYADRKRDVSELQALLTYVNAGGVVLWWLYAACALSKNYRQADWKRDGDGWTGSHNYIIVQTPASRREYKMHVHGKSIDTRAWSNINSTVANHAEKLFTTFWTSRDSLAPSESPLFIQLVRTMATRVYYVECRHGRKGC